MSELQIKFTSSDSCLKEQANFITNFLNKLIENGLDKNCAKSIAEYLFNAFQSKGIITFDEACSASGNNSIEIVLVPNINIEMLFREWLKNEESTND